MTATACPLQTQLPHSTVEASGGAAPDLRCYKLGKKRWSYNAVELRLANPDGDRCVAVEHAAASSARLAQAHQGSAVSFLLDLESGPKLQAHLYCVFDGPRSADGAAAAGGRGRRGPDAPGPAVAGFSWNLVTRQHCCKGCEGPVLRSIQRFGQQLGKRPASGSSTKKTAAAAAPAAAEEEVGSIASTAAGASPAPTATPKRKAVQPKDPRFMYLSFDEACTHVGASTFRLVAGIYNRQGTRLLATSVSAPIKVLANNDVPTGPARIVLDAQLPEDWEGWASGSGAAAQRSRTVRRKLTLKDTTPSPAAPVFSPARQFEPVPCSAHGSLQRSSTSPQLALAAWGSEAVGSPAAPPVPAWRQQSLPAQLPSMLPANDWCGGMGSLASPAELWTTSPSELAAQLPAAQLTHLGCDEAHAQREAERQISLLQQLKVAIASSSTPAGSSCSSPRATRYASFGSVQSSLIPTPAGPLASYMACTPAQPLPLDLLPANSLLTANTLGPPELHAHGLGLPALELCGAQDELELEALHSLMATDSCTSSDGLLDFAFQPVFGASGDMLALCL